MLHHKDQCSRTKMQPSYVPKKIFTDKTANGLTTCVIAFLNLAGMQAERISNSGRYLQGKSISRGFFGSVHTPGKFIPGSGRNGTADISSTITVSIGGKIAGLSVKWEVKMSDKQSEAQKEYEAEVQAAGGRYYIIHNWTEFWNKYSSLLKEFKHDTTR